MDEGYPGVRMEVAGLSSGYHRRPVLHGMSLHLSAGEIVALVGRNGSGKSTLLRTIAGSLPVWGGTIKLDGVPINETPIRERLRVGVAYLPQGGAVFETLTIRENLKLARLAGINRREFKRNLFNADVLLPKKVVQHADHPVEKLSGGERQFVALARVLLSRPRVLLLDEPTIGMSQGLVHWLMLHLRRLSNETGCSILIAEQHVKEVLEIADRVYVVRNGALSFSGHPHELQTYERLRSFLL